jgi:hypothetical protein
MNITRLIEIIALPLAGIALIEAVHTKQTELLLFFIPFLICVLRLFLRSLNTKPDGNISDHDQFSRFFARGQFVNQLSLLPLLLLEAAAVIASSPSTPAIAWLYVASLYLSYVLMRLLAEYYLQKASALVVL